LFRPRRRSKATHFSFFNCVVRAGDFYTDSDDEQQRSKRKRPATKLESYGLCGFNCIAVFFAFFVWLFVIIHLTSSPDPNWTTFPTECGPGHEMNCARIANVNFRIDASPPVFNSTSLDAIQLVRKWTDSQQRTTILYASPTFFHARFVSSFWGFADDLAVTVFCNNTQAVLYLQSQSRIGKGDLSANVNRLQALIDYVNAHKQDVPYGICV